MLSLSKEKKTILIVFVAALGYFVDAYDLILFIVVRKMSLIGIGIPNEKLTEIGISLFNVQMLGTLLGGIFFGVLGDKKGRLSVLFGSILLYSVANLLNSSINSLWQYYVLRFIAGFGLAGELGAGITLVAEILPQKYRGYGTAIVAAVGAFGAFFAGMVGDYFNWRVSYLVGGGMGLLLLLLRFGTFESGMYHSAQQQNVKKGDFLSIFTDLKKLKKYIALILISLPIFFAITILVQIAPEIVKNLNISPDFKVGRAVMMVYFGLTFGDLACGLLSQYFQNRKKAIQLFLGIGLLATFIHLTLNGVTLNILYASYIFLGFGGGFWVSLITISAEQFGTNIRATVATTIPNFARAAAIPISFLFQAINKNNHFDFVNSAKISAIICFSLAFMATFLIKDTFSKDLDYTD